MANSEISKASMERLIEALRWLKSQYDQSPKSTNKAGDQNGTGAGSAPKQVEGTRDE